MIDTEALRKKVIDLAIQGKLTEQIPSDGDADALIKQIANEKSDLIRQGKIPKEKNLPNISEEEIPFGIPDSWRWVRVQDVASYITDYVANGSFATLKEHTKTYKEPNYAIFVRTMDFSSDFKEGCSYIDKESYDFLEKSKLFGGELILPNIGASIGKAFVMPDLGMPMSLAPNSILLKFIYSEMNEYFSFVVKSTYGQQLLNKTQGGSATAKFSKTDLRTLVVPLPTSGEISRIVNKVREIESYIDIIDDLQAKYSNDLVVLKSKIIDAGIQGKLTEQLPEDGDAEDLYAQILNQKSQLIKEGKIKKEKPLPDIAADEIPFEIPKNWKWVRMSEVIDVRDGTHDSPQYHKEGIPLVTSKNLSTGILDFENVKYISQEDADKINERSAVDDGDILFAMIGTIGNPVIVKKDHEFCIKNVALFKKYQNTEILSEYIYWFLMREQEEFKKIVSGGLQPFISLKQFRAHLMPLPPLNEQKRIVSKVSEVLQQMS